MTAQLSYVSQNVHFAFGRLYPSLQATPVDLTGKTVIVTGSNSGIGLEAARLFALNGARVVLACRRLQSAEDAARDIKTSAAGARIDVMELDVSSLDSVKTFVERWQRQLVQDRAVHVLALNAGSVFFSKKHIDGHEQTYATNQCVRAHRTH